MIREHSPSCSDHKMITVRIQRKDGKMSIRDRTQDFWRANFSFCKKLLGRTSCKTVIRGKVYRKATWKLKEIKNISWEFRNKASYCTEGHNILPKLRLAKQGVSYWTKMQKKSILELESRTGYKGGLQKHCVSTKYRPLQKAKVQLELRQVKNIKGKKKGSLKYSSSKWKLRKKMHICSWRKITKWQMIRKSLKYSMSF